MTMAAVRRVERTLARIPPVRMLRAVPETGAFAVRTLVRRRTRELVPGMPDARLTPALLAHVAMDEALLTMAMGPERFPRRDDYARVGREVTAARCLFDERGWLAEPRSYHQHPPALDHVQIGNAWANTMRYERVVWESGFEPRGDEPGAGRWGGYRANRLSSAWMLRHRDDQPRSLADLPSRLRHGLRVHGLPGVSGCAPPPRPGSQPDRADVAPARSSQGLTAQWRSVRRLRRGTRGITSATCGRRRSRRSSTEHCEAPVSRPSRRLVTRRAFRTRVASTDG